MPPTILSARTSTPNPSGDLEEELNKFKLDLKENSLRMMKIGIPEKIISLTKKYVQSTISMYKSDKEIYSDKEEKLFLLIKEEFHKLKVENLELCELVINIKLFINLNVPRVEDGNNFGVGVQLDTITQLSRVEDGSLLSTENFYKYLEGRARIYRKSKKHESSIYEEMLLSFDEKQLKLIWIARVDLRNNYANLYDIMMKNIDRILCPRSDNSVNMY